MRRLTTRSGYALLSLCFALCAHAQPAGTPTAKGQGHVTSATAAGSAAREPLSQPPGEITLQNRFLSALRFTYSEGEPQKVYTTLGFSFSDDFEAVMRQHPPALETAKKARLFNGIALGGSALMLVGSIQMLQSSLDQAEAVNQGDLFAAEDGTEGLGTVLLGSIAVGAGSVLARRALKQGVRMFNERAQAPNSPPPAAPPSTPTADRSPAPQRQDVIHLTDGQVVRGVIVEQVPNEYLRIETPSGRVFDFQMIEVERIRKEAPQDVAAPAEISASASAGVTAEPPAPAERPEGLERWYMYWAVGWTDLSYPDGLAAYTTSLGDRSDTHFSFDLDLLGVYFPLKSHKTIVGGVINGAGDGYFVNDEHIQFNQYLYGLSAMHFVTDYIGRGPFVRADLGIARMVPVSSQNLPFESDSGYGVLVGGGYAFQITKGTRLLLNANYSRKSIGDQTYGKVNVSLGGLF